MNNVFLVHKWPDATNYSKGFDDGNNHQQTQLNDFEYDDYGNMVEDRNKGITEIIYNHLNTSTSLSTGLPKEIKFGTNGTIKYLYDANGNKLKKKVTDGTTNKTVDYLDTSTPLSTGGFQYTNENLEFFPTAEGYVRAVPMSIGGGTSDYSFHYIFNYTDHTSTSLSTGLGNIRLKYTAHPQTGETQPLEENHYYPFACPLRSIRGLTHDGYQPHHDIIGLEGANVTIIPTSPNVGDPYKYKFGGKEYQEEFDINFYDFGARNYDAALGRWMNVDPLAEMMRRHSPYNYTFNNPLRFIDPDGMAPIEPVTRGIVNYVSAKVAQFKSNTAAAVEKLHSSGRSQVKAAITGQQQTNAKITPIGISVNATRDVATMSQSISTITNEAGSIAKDVTRDVANTMEVVGDGMVIVAPATGPAAPIVAGTGATISTGGTVINVSLDVVEGDYQSAGKRVTTGVATGGLGSLAKNAPGVDEATSIIIDSGITIYKNAVDRSVEYKLDENNNN